MKLLKLALPTLLLLVGCAKKQVVVEAVDYTVYVDPFVGTGGHGHVYPGAVAPYPMIQASPDTRMYQWDACAGYHYSDTTINGFSHNHLSGTGCGDYGDILIMPMIGTPEKLDKEGEKSQEMPYCSKFSHENEVAEPGYYSVMLEKHSILTELTATQRAAIYRFTFPESDSATILLDMDYSLSVFGDQRNDILDLQVVGDNAICGSKQTKGWAWEQAINFYAQTSQPFTYTIVKDTVTREGVEKPRLKALLNFKAKKGTPIYFKIALSFVDTEGAKKNLLAEIPGFDFDATRNATRAEWNKVLSRVDVQTTNETDKKIFYTAMYRTSLCPNLASDVDGRYLGMDHKVRTSERPMYTIFSLWDTFRAYHPMMTIIDPERNEDFVNTLVEKYKEGGLLPMWELASNYTGTMIGYNAVSVIADAYIKGYKDFDVEAAFEGCLKSSNGDTSNIIVPRAFIPYLQPESKKYKDKLGYVPCNKEGESVAKALEYAYDDWCISEFAKALGKTDKAEEFAAKGKYYQNYFDTSTNMMRGKYLNGKWRTPFNPYASKHRDDDYCEGIAWQWTWFVPHDVEGLVELMGGKEKFTAQLDSLFFTTRGLEGEDVSADITGLIGLYAHGNEPSHHIAHLYNYVGESYKAQAMLDSIIYSQYRLEPDGIAGNEDCGQMSAWYILNSMGIYQVAPGNPQFSIGRPIFDQATIKLPAGKTFVIKAINNSRTNKYIKSIKLNGNVRNTPFISYSDIMAGGVLEVEMSDKK